MRHSHAPTHQHTSPTIWDVAHFWFPLSLNWQLMAFEAPFIAALISGLPNGKLNLAAFSVAFAWALIIESPVMGLLSVSSALSRNQESFYALRKFMWWINGLVTIAMIIFVSPWGFEFVTTRLLTVTTQIADLAHSASLVMILWPALIGIRRFYQGVSIAGGNPKLVAQGTVIRLISMCVTGLVLATLKLPGAIVGCGALIGAVGSEALAAWLLARPMVRKLKSIESSAEKAISVKSINEIYIPLTVTIFLGMALQPLATFALGRLPNPIDSLATYPVLTGAWFFFIASTLGVQETTIALMTRTHGRAHLVLRRFAISYGAIMSIALGLFCLSGSAAWWYGGWGALPKELIPLLISAISLSIVLPFSRSVESYLRALTVWTRRTGYATAAAIIELVVIAVVAVSLGFNTNLAGISVMAIAIPVGILSAIAYLALTIERFAILSSKAGTDIVSRDV